MTNVIFPRESILKNTHQAFTATEAIFYHISRYTAYPGGRKYHTDQQL